MSGVAGAWAEALRPRLVAANDSLGLRLPADRQELLLAYLGLIVKWNQVYNLTSVRDPSDMLVQHLFDSLAAVPALRRQLAALPAAPRLLDVGSGAGLPGVVFAVCEPGLGVTCIDTVGKKASFIQQVALTLGLSNLRAIHGRVEQMSERYELVSCRAFASLADFVQGSSGAVEEGVWMALKGKRPDEEIAALPQGIEVFHVEQLQVPELDADRCIVWMRRRPSPR